MDNYTEMYHIKREEDHTVIEDKIMESTSHTTVYSSIPSAQDINIPWHIIVRDTENTHMRIKPRNYSRETEWRDYRNHFYKVCVINKWNTYKLQYLCYITME